MTDAEATVDEDSRELSLSTIGLEDTPQSQKLAFEVENGVKNSPDCKDELDLGSLPTALPVEIQAGVPANIAEYTDWALDSIGWGQFQSVYTILLSYPWVICGAQTMAHIFTSLSPERHRVCTSIGNHCSHEVLAASDCSTPRSGYEFQSPELSIAAEFELLCGSAMLVPLLGTLFFLGFLLGVSFFGGIADGHGRRRAYQGALGLQQFAALIICMAPSYAIYAAARFVQGFGIGGMGLVAYVWLAEFFDGNSRSLLVITSNVSFALGMLLLSPLSYAIPQWRWLSLALFLLGVPPLAALPFLLESPKWLAGPASKPKESHTVLCRIASTNQRPEPPPPPLPRAQAPNQEAKQSLRSKLRLLLRDSRLSQRFTVMCFTWFALSLGYYGVSMNVGSIGWDIHLSSALASAVELPMYPLAFRLVQKPFAGRRGTTVGGLVVGGGCCLLAALSMGAGSSEGEAQQMGAGLVILFYAGKGAIALAFGTVYLYAAELFPTDIRSQSMGFQSLCSRVGGMIAPVVADMGNVSRALPLFVFGVPCVAAGLLLCTLPETLGKPMPSVIDDLPAGATTSWPRCLRRYGELDEDPDKSEPPPTSFGARS